MELNIVLGAGNAAVANWFVRRRGLALGVASPGIAAAGVMASIVVRLVAAYGWRDTYTWLAVVFLVLGLPLALVFPRRLEDHGYLPDVGICPMGRRHRKKGSPPRRGELPSIPPGLIPPYAKR